MIASRKCLHQAIEMIESGYMKQEMSSILSTAETVNHTLGLIPEPFSTIPEKYSLQKTQPHRAQGLARKCADATNEIQRNPNLREAILKNLANLLKEHVNDYTLLQFLAQCSVDTVTGTIYFPDSPIKKAA